VNEVPEDEGPGCVSEEIAWAMQTNFLGSKDSVTAYKGNFYHLTIKNYSGHNYDWDFWPDKDNFHQQWGILFDQNDTNSKNLALNKMRNRFGNSLNESTEGSATVGCGYLFLSLLEIPKANKENRYY